MYAEKNNLVIGQWDEQAAGYFVYDLPDGRLIHILPMIFNHRVAVSLVELTRPDKVDQAAGVLDAWCYDDLPQALAACLAWDPMTEKEPRGWKKHPFTGRRHDGQDPEREVVDLPERRAHGVA